MRPGLGTQPVARSGPLPTWAFFPCCLWVDPLPAPRGESGVSLVLLGPKPSAVILCGQKWRQDPERNQRGLAMDPPRAGAEWCPKQWARTRSTSVPLCLLEMPVPGTPLPAPACVRGSGAGHRDRGQLSRPCSSASPPWPWAASRPRTSGAGVASLACRGLP